MPRRDKTGPNGMGPGTGRGLGRCIDNYPRRERGVLRRNRRFLDLSKEEKRDILEEEIQILKDDLNELDQELSSLEK
jgi:hypothetical protein